MSAFGNSSIDYFSQTTRPRVNVLPAADGLFCLNSDDRPADQPYNNFVISGRGVILAGEFSGIKVTECNFPYLIPNVNSNNNTFVLDRYVGGVDNYRTITVPVGYYTAAALVTKINQLIQAAFPGTSIVFSYDLTTLRFTVESTAPEEFALYARQDSIENTQSLLRLMGLPVSPIDGVYVTDLEIGAPTTLQYTKYIDFCSDVLTQYQTINDTSTASLNKRHIFCRLYISSDISLPQTEVGGNPVFAGSSVPFMIYRQFKNPKTLRWNGKDSIDRIDVQAFDDAGEPLASVPGMPGFQFTFEASE